MDGLTTTAALYGLGALGTAAAAVKARARLELSRAKHRSLSGHARMAAAIAKLLPGYRYNDAQLFAVDDAPETIVAARRADFDRLAAIFRTRSPRPLELTRHATGQISDLQFTEAYRVPFQFSPYVRTHLPVGTFVAASSGVKVTDLDGN